jgi:hypothetical protein
MLAKPIAIATLAERVIDVDFIFRSFHGFAHDLIDRRVVVQDIEAGMRGRKSEGGAGGREAAPPVRFRHRAQPPPASHGLVRP